MVRGKCGRVYQRMPHEEIKLKQVMRVPPGTTSEVADVQDVVL